MYIYIASLEHTIHFPADKNSFNFQYLNDLQNYI